MGSFFKRKEITGNYNYMSNVILFCFPRMLSIQAPCTTSYSLQTKLPYITIRMFTLKCWWYYVKELLASKNSIIILLLLCMLSRNRYAAYLCYEAERIVNVIQQRITALVTLEIVPYNACNKEREKSNQIVFIKTINIQNLQNS